MEISGIRRLSLYAWVSIVAYFVLGLSDHRTSVLGNEDKCVPSSCGDIHNISYPFRLQHDPKNCGDSNFTLDCDNNVTILRLSSGMYYVKAIDYDNRRIRVVDPGLEKNNCSSLPRFPLASSNISYPYYPSWPYWNYGASDSDTVTVTFLKCANPVNSSRYVNTAPCIKSQGYVYAIEGDLWTGEMENGCTVYWLGMSTEMWKEKERNISYQDLHNRMLYGFWLQYGWSFGECPGQWFYKAACYPRSIPGFFQLVTAFCGKWMAFRGKCQF